MALLDRFGRPMPKVSPFRESGTSGYAVYGGYIATKEKSGTLFGAERYRTASDILANISIVAAGVRYFLNLLAKPKWKVDTDDSAQAKQLGEFVEEIMNDMETPWHRVARRMGLYRWHGFGIQEWTAKKREDGKIGLLDIESRPQHTIERWQVDDKGTVQGVWQRSPQTGQELPLPRNKIIYVVDDTLTDSPEGMGWFRHCVDPAKRLSTYLQLEGYGFQRDLSGTPVGYAPLTQINKAVANNLITEEQARAMKQVMEDFVKMQAKKPDTGLLLDSEPFQSLTADGFQVSSIPQWKVELLTAAVGSIGQIDKAISRITYDIARIIGIENMLTGSDGVGSLALSKDKSGNLFLQANSTLFDMSTQMSKDVIDPIWALNGLPKELKPKLVTEDVAFKDAAQIAAVLRDMATAGQPLQPDDPVGDDLRDIMGVSHAPELDEELLGALRNQSAGLLPDGTHPSEIDIAEADKDRALASKKPNGSGRPFGGAQ